MRINPGQPNQPAVPIAAYDEEAAHIFLHLIKDAGLEGRILPGGLTASRLFDTGTDSGPNSGMANKKYLKFWVWKIKETYSSDAVSHACVMDNCSWNIW
jgi:hypothetical protein